MRYRHIDTKPPLRRTHAYITIGVTLVVALMLAFKWVESDVIWIIVGGAAVTLAILIGEDVLFLRRHP